ncbi:MAG: hypothetical protein ACYCPQ_09880 [Elusimicrobiota bacterium]
MNARVLHSSFLLTLAVGTVTLSAGRSQAVMDEIDATSQAQASSFGAIAGIGGLGQESLGFDAGTAIPIDSMEMQEDFSQTAALSPAAPRAAPGRKTVNSGARENKKSSAADRQVRALASSLKESRGGANARALDAFYSGDISYPSDAPAAPDARRQAWERRQDRALKKDRDWVNVSQSAASVSRILASKHPKIAIDVARRGLRDRSQIVAEFTAQSLGQISEIRVMRRYPEEIGSLYKIALRQKDLNVGRYAAKDLDLYGRAFFAVSPRTVISIFQMALRSSDAYISGYALQCLPNLPTKLQRALEKDAGRARSERSGVAS